MHSTAVVDRRPSLLPLALAAWGSLSALAAAAGVFSLERRALVPLCIAGGAVGLIAAYRASGSFRASVDRVSTALIVALHAVRLPIGAAFVYEWTRGRLPAEFALHAGPGDMLAGALAIPMALALRDGAPHRRALLAWNVLAFADIVSVAAHAQRIVLFSDHPERLVGLMRFPYGTLPTFVVPLVMATHVLVFARLRRAVTR
ncbi:MAG: hypothetical protein R3A52_08705 [Polyangiales bacterium]